ncbi:hypothetical protein AB834_02675 [PVC group bacterium (ex Bugula neritina AB1)]|nr:hypothetical protein AB834_02675 [PVC group bacterium (ex Bugula neritina AB1)]
MKRFFLVTIHLPIILCGCFGGFSIANNSFLQKTTEILLDPENTNSSLRPYATVLTTVAIIEKTPPLKKAVNYPNKVVMHGLQKEDLFEHDETLTLLLDADNPMKETLAI